MSRRRRGTVSADPAAPDGATDWSQRWAGGPAQWGIDTGRTGPNGFAVLGLVVSVLGCLASITVVGGVVLGLVGAGLAALGRSRARAGRAGQAGVALAGIIAGALAVVLSAVILVAFLTSSSFHHYRSCRRSAITLTQLNACSHLLHYL